MPVVDINRSLIKRLAGLELNNLLYAKILPSDIFQRSRIKSSGTPIYDISGEILFHRIPIVKNRKIIATTDIAVNSAFRLPLLGVNYGYEWNEKKILKSAILAVKKYRKKFQYDKIRFVSYSYPKIAIQFLKDEKEMVMLELGTWKPVPPQRKRRKDESPSNFERWSLTEEISPSRKKTNLRRFTNQVKRWDKAVPLRKKFNALSLNAVEFKKAVHLPKFITYTREVHYGSEKTNNHPCYELRGQLTNVWCVAASVQMLLDFYRYNYVQTRIADELGLGTITNPNGLPYSRDGDVVTVLENLTNNALDANMDSNPQWTEFTNEIEHDRPLISFIPGHSRTVAGYTYSRFTSFGFIFRGLLVYDPWPPTTGVITRWENFDAQTYRVMFTAHLTLEE